MPRLLIVEDDAAIAVALEDDFRLEGFAVEVVADGEAAVRRVRGTPFDLVLLDVMLPGKDGFEVCREMRKAGVQAKILLLTARGSDTDKVIGLDLGADDYVTKPYSPKELRARVRALLRRADAEEGHRSAVTPFGDCELDLARGELRRDGKAVPLTPLEFKLLALFVRRPGRVLTRRVLIDEIWGHDTAITERVVDNQIANLRRKIEAKPAEPRFLKSVRGIRYRCDLQDVTQS
jgi:DNA-binding response OmpR family regulator